MLTMSSNRIGRRAMAAAGGVALITMGLIAGCGSKGNEAPSTTPTTSTTTTAPSSPPPVSPTEKSISPTGGNSFSPAVTAPGAPGVAPGQHPGINGVP
jgi:hypothetical protein